MAEPQHTTSTEHVPASEHKAGFPPFDAHSFASQLVWLVVPIEIISFLSRPLSHSLRLWGNILAGHIVLKVFGGMVVALLGAGAWGIVSVLPLGMAVALTGLEFLVAALQAFVFAVLTCVYLNDAIHPGH